MLAAWWAICVRFQISGGQPEAPCTAVRRVALSHGLIVHACHPKSPRRLVRASDEVVGLSDFFTVSSSLGLTDFQKSHGESQ